MDAKYCGECVCLSVCDCLSLSVGQDISGTTRATVNNFLCMLPMSVARSSSGMLTIGRIAYWREGGDGNAQSGRSVIYTIALLHFVNFFSRHRRWQISYELSCAYSSLQSENPPKYRDFNSIILMLNHVYIIYNSLTDYRPNLA